MRWFRIRRAEIIPEERQHFEELGTEIVRSYFTQGPGTVVYTDGKQRFTVNNLHPSMQLWLREQYDRAELRETWLITMEAAITTFALAGTIFSVLDFCCRHSK
jgi:hypothetical protein